MKNQLDDRKISDMVVNAVELMALSARTAPKAGGQDFVVIKILYGDDVLRLGKGMIQYGIDSNKTRFDRDGKT